MKQLVSVVQEVLEEENEIEEMMKEKRVMMKKSLSQMLVDLERVDQSKKNQAVMMRDL